LYAIDLSEHQKIYIRIERLLLINCILTN